MTIRERQKKSRMTSTSLRLSLLTFSLIFVLFPSTSGVQVCENGTYLRQLHVKTSFSAGDMTSSLPMSTAPDCTPCNSTVPFCYNCHVSITADEVNCTECFAGYHSAHDGRNCSSSSSSSSGHPPPWFVGLAVGVVVGVVVVVALVILVVCLVRDGKCSATTTPPPALPDPDHLTNSYKVNKPQNASQQRRDHRYAKEPGPTSPRVESVQYDGVKVDFKNESSPYVNCSGVTSTANAKPKTKEKEEEEEEYDEVYVNSPPLQNPSSSRGSKANPPSARDPGPKKPKPQRKQKDGGGAQGQGHAQTEEAPSKKPSAKVERVSVFPPDDEQVYCNEPQSEDEEDYVNADVTQMRAGR